MQTNIKCMDCDEPVSGSLTSMIGNSECTFYFCKKHLNEHIKEVIKIQDKNGKKD